RTCGLRIRSPTLYPTERRAPQQLAEREGFEPSIQLWTVYWFSKPAPSASRPPLPISRKSVRSASRRAPRKRSVLDRAPLCVKENGAARRAPAPAAHAGHPTVAHLDRAAAFEAGGGRV